MAGFDIEVVAVTGVSAAVAKRFAHEGASVVASANERKYESVAAEMVALSGRDRQTGQSHTQTRGLRA